MGLRLVATALVAALQLGGATAFVPHSLTTSTPATRTTTARHFGVDPSVFHDVAHQLHHVPGVFSTMTLSDAADTIADAASAVTQPFADAAASAASSVSSDAADAVAEAAKDDNGWFGFLTLPIEGLLQVIHSVLTGVGMSENSWGVTIIAMTLIIKLVTFPLTKSQLESTSKMQALQPSIKQMQAKYESNPEVMNQKIAELYQTNNVNPLAGCLPSLVQIPVFIGLYRAVLDLAKNDKLDEAFLFLPNLEGPTYGADPAHGSDWLFQGWVDGVPSLGWDNTVAFLALPIFLVISQFISMEIMQPKDASPQQNNIVLKLLPLMIGWFSLNVPAALCIYWAVNNIITTATTLIIRAGIDTTPITTGSGSAAASASTIFAPPPPKPSGFGDVGSSRSNVGSNRSVSVDSSGVKPITSNIVDAEVVSITKEEPEPQSDDEVSSTGNSGVLEERAAGMQKEQPTSKRGGKKGKKKKKN